MGKKLIWETQEYDQIVTLRNVQQVGEKVFNNNAVGTQPSGTFAISKWETEGFYVIRVDDYYSGNNQHYVDEAIFTGSLFCSSSQKRHTISGARYVDSFMTFYKNSNDLTITLPQIANQATTETRPITVTVYKIL